MVVLWGGLLLGLYPMARVSFHQRNHAFTHESHPPRQARCNDSWVREVCLTGRRFGAAEAVRLGFMGEMVEGGRAEVVARAMELAVLIASKSPVAVYGIK